MKQIINTILLLLVVLSSCSNLQDVEEHVEQFNEDMLGVRITYSYPKDIAVRNNDYLVVPTKLMLDVNDYIIAECDTIYAIDINSEYTNTIELLVPKADITHARLLSKFIPMTLGGAYITSQQVIRSKSKEWKTDNEFLEIINHLSDNGYGIYI